MTRAQRRTTHKSDPDFRRFHHGFVAGGRKCLDVPLLAQDLPRLVIAPGSTVFSSLPKSVKGGAGDVADRLKLPRCPDRLAEPDDARTPSPKTWARPGYGRAAIRSFPRRWSGGCRSKDCRKGRAWGRCRVR